MTFVYVVTIFLPRLSISRIYPLCTFFIVSIYISGHESFPSSFCLFFFTFFAFLRGFIDFLLFHLCLFLKFFKGLFFIFYLRTSIILKLFLSLFSCASAALEGSGLAVKQLSSGGIILSFLLLTVFLHCI